MLIFVLRELLAPYLIGPDTGILWFCSTSSGKCRNNICTSDGRECADSYTPSVIMLTPDAAQYKVLRWKSVVKWPEDHLPQNWLVPPSPHNKLHIRVRTASAQAAWMLTDFVLWRWGFLWVYSRNVHIYSWYSCSTKLGCCEKKSLLGNTNCGSVILYTYSESSFERKINKSKSR
jgi:hypothetical protein